MASHWHCGMVEPDMELNEDLRQAIVKAACSWGVVSQTNEIKLHSSLATCLEQRSKIWMWVVII